MSAEKRLERLEAVLSAPTGNDGYAKAAFLGIQPQPSILQRFEQWLDDALATEDPPAGIDGEILEALAADDKGNGEPDRRCDSYALWAAMTALTQEVKLQGRAFKELNDTLGSQAGRIGEEMRAVVVAAPTTTTTSASAFSKPRVRENASSWFAGRQAQR